MNRVLQGLIGPVCLVYIDDVLIFGKSKDEFTINLELVLNRIKDYGLKLNPKKCLIGFQSLEFLGFVISKFGKEISPSRLNGIVNMARPRSKTEVRSFLGLINFVRDFIPNCSVICHDMRRLTEKDEKFVWSEKLDKQFIKIKQIIKSSIRLAFPDDNQELHLFTDASDYGMGGILLQISKTGKRSPLALISKALSAVQRRWSTYEKEAWAIVSSIHKLDYFLRGHNFTLHTDHRNLTFLRTDTSAKVGRWFLSLSEYSFDIIHVAGAQNGAADC
ncbi:hypothetical protein ADUPG1_005129, partial [Aduncisulcus paluster]